MQMRRERASLVFQSSVSIVQGGTKSLHCKLRSRGMICLAHVILWYYIKGGSKPPSAQMKPWYCTRNVTHEGTGNMQLRRTQEMEVPGNLKHASFPVKPRALRYTVRRLVHTCLFGTTKTRTSGTWDWWEDLAPGWLSACSTFHRVCWAQHS